MIKLLIFSLFYGFVFTSCESTITINIQDSSNSINQQDKAPTTVNINGSSNLMVCAPLLEEKSSIES